MDSTSYGISTLNADIALKNGISVGAIADGVDDSTRGTSAPSGDKMTYFSSWGPTRDGRIKPDLVAPGWEIQSTYPNSTKREYGTHSGTSMAAPAVSGIAALVTEAFQLQNLGKKPKASTIKAALICTARDLTRDTNDNARFFGPDYRYGWGLVDAEAAVEKVRNGWLHQGRMVKDTSGLYSVPTHSFIFPVEPGQQQLNVSLVWTDPAGAKLHNDLDLQLTGPNGWTYCPWTLDPARPDQRARKLTIAALGAAGLCPPDRLNNVEQVTVANPVPGKWEARITTDENRMMDHGQLYSICLPVKPTEGGQLKIEWHKIKSAHGGAESDAITNVSRLQHEPGFELPFDQLVRVEISLVQHPINIR